MPDLPERARELVSARQENTKHDTAARRRSQRRGRERGCWVYVPAEELLRAGIDLEGTPPYYRTWGTQRGGVLVRLYKEP